MSSSITLEESVGTVNTAITLTFPGGKITGDDYPIINLALENLSFTKKQVLYLTAGATDAGQDLTASNIVALYVDPGTTEIEYTPIKSLMIRCIEGEGVFHFNLDLAKYPVAKYVPGHYISAAGNGLISYTFNNPPQVSSFDDAGTTKLINNVLYSIYLRTFVDVNRFQVTLFK